MLKGFEIRNLTITNVVLFESNLIYNNCNFVFPQTGFNLLPGRAVKYSMPKQASVPYHMETVYLTISNFISFEAELNLEYSKVF